MNSLIVAGPCRSRDYSCTKIVIDNEIQLIIHPWSPVITTTKPRLLSTGNPGNVTTGRLPAVLPVPGREYMKAGDGGVVSQGDVAAFEAHLLEGEPKGQQIGTHSQEELQQETAEEVVLSLRREDKETIGVRLLLSCF